MNWLIPATFRVPTLQRTASNWNARTNQVRVVSNYTATTKLTQIIT